MDNSYQLIDSGGFRKFEQVGPFRIIRQALSAVWDPKLPHAEWNQADAEFIRGPEGSGEWKIKNKELEKPLQISIDGIQFQIKLTSFGHLGIFPEQRQHWQTLETWTKNQKAKGRPIKVLNLFAYTGGATLFAARAGAEVAHVDASKGTVKWASENAKVSGLGEAKIRWLIDDVKEFVAKDVRRGTKYDVVILDPPSYGKGEKKQIWKIEKDLTTLLWQIRKILNLEQECLVCLSAHTEGYSPISLRNQLFTVFGAGEIEMGEMVIPDQFERPLPSGAGAIIRTAPK